MKKLIGIISTFWLCVAAMAQGPTLSVGLKWQPNTEPDLAGYRLYRGTESGRYDWMLDTGLVTAAEARGLEPGKTYFFALTALGSTFGTQQLESGYSNEVTYTTPGGEPVTAITGWTGRREDGKVTITWDAAPPGQYVGRWRVLWSRKGSSDVQELWAASPKFEFAAPDRSEAFTVFVQAEGLQGLGPQTMIEVPKFPDPVRLEIEPGTEKVVFQTAVDR